MPPSENSRGGCGRIAHRRRDPLNPAPIGDEGLVKVKTVSMPMLCAGVTHHKGRRLRWARADQEATSGTMARIEQRRTPHQP